MGCLSRRGFKSHHLHGQFTLYFTPISKRYHRRIQKKVFKKTLRKNEEIRVPSVLLIDENGQGKGAVPTYQALQMARLAELDLVEVSPIAQPPVCKIMDYGQFVYRQEKAERKHKAKQKKVDIKGVRLSLRMSDHDREVRKMQAEKFLEKGHRLKIEMNLRGRERERLDMAHGIMNVFIKGLSRELVVDQPFSRQGGRVMLVVMPKS